MSVSFDWDFQETDESFPGYRGDVPPPGWHAWLRRGGVVLVLLLVVGSAAFAWVRRRLETVEQAEADLRQVVELELKHIAHGDVELLRALQDPVALQWQERQLVRYVSNPNGSFVPAPGLSPAGRPPEILQVRVFGHTGRVRLVHWFQPTAQAPADSSPARNSLFSAWSGAVPFYVTWFYHLDEDGAWYHTAPPGDHPGVPYSWHGSRFDIYATEMEAQALEPVVVELFSLVRRACRLFDCPPQAHYSLRFEDVPGPEIRGHQWSLPALYLSGMPQDAPSRAAWAHALKRWLVEALAQARVERENLAQRIVYRQLVTQAQAELGLIEPPTPDDGILAQALEAGKQHPLWSLWQARCDPDDPQKTRLLEAEVTALLQFIQSKVGSTRLFALLPALDDYERLGDALVDLYGLARLDVTVSWSAYLSQLTGVSVAAGLAPRAESVDPSLRLLRPVPLSQPPGDQVALACDGQILVGNLDGSGVAPLTPGGHYFTYPLWSPDGRWLFTTQQRGPTSNTPFLLASDGSELRPLPDAPSPAQSLIGRSLGGRRIYYTGSKPASDQPGQQVQSVWVVDVETGARCELPVWRPLLSPDGRWVVYFKQPYQGLSDALWLADVNGAAGLGQEWENARQIERGAGTMLLQSAWSPDSTKLALNLYSDADGHTIAIYDLATERLIPLTTLADLADALLSSKGSLLASEADPAAILADNPLLGLSIEGWSADASCLAIKVYESLTREPPFMAVLVVPLDGSPPRVLALSEQVPDMNALWSPSDPDRLVLTQSSSDILASYLLDLESGPLYTTTQGAYATWSPDGAWVAFAETDQNTIVDQEGQPRFTWRHDCDFALLFWNPTADLPSEITCHTGLDLWISARDVHRVGDTLTVVIHNSGDQAVENGVLVNVAEAGATESEVMRYGTNRAVPPCGILLLHLRVQGDWNGPLSVRVSSPDGIEENLENNQVTLYPSPP